MPPTLMQKHKYIWPEGSKLTAREKYITDNFSAIDIICEILKYKLDNYNQNIQSKIFILKAFTASGKSSVFPRWVYKNLLVQRNRALFMAEPRKNLCDNGINDIKSYSDYQLGKELAIHTGDIQISSVDKYYMEFGTTQIIQNFLNSILEANTKKDFQRITYLLNKYLIILVDETHILELPTLSVIASIKQVLDLFSNRKDCPIFVFASATLNIESFLDYFGLMKPDISLKYLIGTVEGVPNFPMKAITLSNEEVQYWNENYKDIYTAFAKYFAKNIYWELFKSNSYVFIEEFNKSYQCRDALIFVPSLKNIQTIGEGIKKLVHDQKRPSLFLTREMQTEELQRWREINKGKERVLYLGYSAEYSALSLQLLEAPYESDDDVLTYETHIIISTPVIETGKTIFLLKYSCDLGYTTTPIYYPLVYKPYQNNLMKIPANQSQIIQRRGRISRKSPGTYVSFFTNESFENRMISDLPETVNNGCLSELIYYSELIKFENPIAIDIVQLNKYIYPISPDLEIKLINDLFFAGIIGSNGEYMMKKIDEKWKMYAKLAYYILKWPLFISIMTAAINSYNFPPMFHIHEFSEKSFPKSIDSCIKEYYRKSIDFIPIGRKYFIEIIEGKSKDIIPYRGDFYSSINTK